LEGESSGWQLTNHDKTNNANLGMTIDYDMEREYKATVLLTQQGWSSEPAIRAHSHQLKTG